MALGGYRVGSGMKKGTKLKEIIKDQRLVVIYTKDESDYIKTQAKHQNKSVSCYLIDKVFNR